MPKGDAMSSTGFSIWTASATVIYKFKKKLYQSDLGSSPYQGLTPELLTRNLAMHSRTPTTAYAATMWTYKADQLASPSTYKYKYK